MTPKRRGSANTKVSPSLEESSNPKTMQINQLAKMIQGYEEKNNATAEMMMEIKRMFDEKLQTLEKENNFLREKAERSEQSKTERNLFSQSKKTKEESEIKIVESSTKSPESSVASSLKTINSSKKTNQHKERNNSKRKEKEKPINLIELNEKLIEEVI